MMKQNFLIFMLMLSIVCSIMILVFAVPSFNNGISPINKEAFAGLAAIAVVSAICVATAIIIYKHTMNRLKAELAALHDGMRKANNAKIDFLAKVSHEMRTPLNAIIGLSQLSLDARTLCEKEYENVESIYNAGSTLLSIVNNILDISKIEAGKLEIVPVKYELASLLSDTVAQSILYVGEKPIKFVLDIDEYLPEYLYGDDLKIKQIMNNLLSNAFKYTKEGSVELGVRCTREGESAWLTIWVRDTGIGIHPQYVDRLFSDYTKLDLVKNRGIIGTGLGLAITKSIADMMGGSVAVASTYGTGSVFTARIRQQAVDCLTIGPETIKNLKEFNYHNCKRNLRTRLTPIKLPYARVLIVDDNTINLDVVKGMMKPYGMRIDCVMDGLQAVAAIRSETVRYHAIFMDHMMPDMDGIEATRIIREEIGTEYAKTIPIIALTANAVKGTEEAFLRHGFQAFVSKPIDLKRLDAVIMKWVRDKEAEETYERTADNKAVRDGKENRVLLDRRSGVDRRKLGDQTVRLNIADGIKRFGGDEEAYLQVLRSFEVNAPRILGTIKEISAARLSDYAIKMHGLKSAGRSICASIVADMAEMLEKAAKAGDIGFVGIHTAAFVNAIEILLADIRAVLTEKVGQPSIPEKDRPDIETLSRLLTACTQYHMDEVYAAMAEIESCHYQSDDGLALRLRENVDAMNFAQIREELNYLLADYEKIKGVPNV